MSPDEFDHLLQCVNALPGHGLKDLKKAALMNRVDTKYIVPTAQLPQIFAALEGHFSALEIGNTRCFRYESLYFDTEDHRLYHMHRAGHLNRHKVRMRHYADSATQFLEVKFKNNKKRTLKERIAMPTFDALRISDYLDFLHSLNVPTPERLRPSLHNGYQRIALASEARGERLTIDLQLANELADSSQPRVPLHNIAIVELKQSKLDRRSPFVAIARQLGIRPSGFSKYCMGMTLALRDQAGWKYNRFKPVLRQLERDQLKLACAQ